MGLASAKITLSNPRLDDPKPIEVDASADSGANFLRLPEEIVHELRLEGHSEKEVVTADGQRQTFRYVGPVRVGFENRSCYAGAVVMGDQGLLGAIPVEGMDLVVLPLERRVAVHPLHPNYAAGLAKGNVRPV